MQTCVVVGTRPEIIKMSCVLHELRAKGVPCDVIHTGQHHDSNLSDIFFKELDLPPPDMNLRIGSGSQATQTGSAMIRLEQAFQEIRPDLVLVEGDTNTVLAAALAAVKLGIAIGHVEAGLRSYDLRMPEEHNRRVTDHLSSLLFAPTEPAAQNLRMESCWGQVHVTGNTVIDACMRYGPRAEKCSTILENIPFDHFALVTTHRAENVDDPWTLKQFFKIFTNSPIPLVYPVHPRTLQRFRDMLLEDELKNSENIVLFPPVGYYDFLKLMMHCSVVLTDSGGIQEEATAPNIRKKVFVLRKTTERPEAVSSGFAEVVGIAADKVLERLGDFLRTRWEPNAQSPFGEGGASQNIVRVIENCSIKRDLKKGHTQPPSRLRNLASGKGRKSSNRKRSSRVKPIRLPRANTLNP